MKKSLIYIGIAAFSLMGCLGDDPVTSANSTSSADDSSNDSLSSEESDNESSSESSNDSSVKDIEGEWAYSIVAGGGPNDYLITIEDDGSISFELKILGSVKNTAEGSIEFDGDVIEIDWEVCKHKSDEVDCDSSDASKIPSELGFDGENIFHSSDKSKSYEKQ